MASEIPITHKRCRRCKEAKHRQQFLPRIGTEVKRYDVYCHACRAKDFYIPPNILDQRVKEGLMRPKRREKIKVQHKENKATGIAKAKVQGKINEKLRSWAPAVKSLAKCRYIMGKHKFQEGCVEWCIEMHKLLHRSSEYIKQEKTQQKLPANRVVFWYDVAGLVDEYRALVDAYPAGKENCPLTYF